MTVGEKIKLRREQLGLSQEELALKVGYKSRSSINKIELSRDLPLKKVRLIADALDLSVSYLMGWENEPNPTFELYKQYREDVAMDMLSDEDKELLESFKSLDSDNKRMIFEMIAYALAKQNGKL